MFLRKMQMPQQGMPTAEEFALWGARELSFEELLAVNGGKREKKKNRAARVHPPVQAAQAHQAVRAVVQVRERAARQKNQVRVKKRKKMQRLRPVRLHLMKKKNKPPVQSGTPSVNSPNIGESKKNEEKQGGSASYTVREGDTLNGIIRKQYPGASNEEVERRVKEVVAKQRDN